MDFNNILQTASEDKPYFPASFLFMSKEYLNNCKWSNRKNEITDLWFPAPEISLNHSKTEMSKKYITQHKRH